MKNKNEYPKLVRDKIPEIIKKNTGQVPRTKVLKNKALFRKFLFQKAVEEAFELRGAVNKKQVIEEAADILEVIDAILKLYKVDFTTLRKIQKEKRKFRGGFEKKLIIEKKI